MGDYRLTSLAQGLPSSVPFVGPETQERQRGAPFLARLGANESVFGPSPKAVTAMAAAASEIWKYGDPKNHDLTRALARFHGIAPETIMVGEGIDGLLGLVVRLFVGPGDSVVTSDGAYPTFNYHVAGFGGTLHKVPYAGDHEDPGALLDAAKRTDAKLIYMANPDNPMGSWHDADRMAELFANLPAGCVLVLDEAYVELAPEGTAPPIAQIHPQVIRMRTFSKAYGMAGARVGYAIGAPGLIAAFNKVRNHFGVSRISKAGALAALDDQAYLSEVKENIRISRQRIGEIGAAHGLIALPSATNFVTLDCGGDGDHARQILAALIKLGLFARMPFVSPQDRAIRISCAPEEQMAIFADLLPRALRMVAA